MHGMLKKSILKLTCYKLYSMITSQRGTAGSVSLFYKLLLFEYFKKYLFTIKDKLYSVVGIAF